MPIPAGLGISYPQSQRFYRITSQGFWTRDARKHKVVVNGGGSLRSSSGARYNYPGAQTVYLTEARSHVLLKKRSTSKRKSYGRLIVSTSRTHLRCHRFIRGLFYGISSSRERFRMFFPYRWRTQFQRAHFRVFCSARRRTIGT
jgi:hypothetical protein